MIFNDCYKYYLWKDVVFLNKFDRKQDFKRDIDVVMLSCCISIYGLLKYK